MAIPPPLPARDALVAFRTGTYAAFGARRDALCDLLDALLTAGPVASPVHLSLAPAHRRGHGSLYAALARGAVSAAAVERLLADQPLPLDEGDVPLYAVDGSVWARCDAETSPERGFYHHPSRHSNGQPIVAGWLYQWVAQVWLTADSWTAPLSVERVPPGTNLNRAAAAQVQRVVLRRPCDGKRPLFLFDAGYDAVQLAQELGLASGRLDIAILVRLRSGRCFYLDPPPYPGRTSGRGGRPRRHGQKFTCDAAQTWWAPTDEHTTDDLRYGHVRVRAWAGVHGKVQEHADRGSRGPAPLERGTLVLLQVERLPRQTRVPKDVWLWWQGPHGALPDFALLWRAYIHRFDVEHTFRFVKETLRWTAPRVRQPAQADRWTALVVLAYTQLRLARPLVADQRLPWERPLSQERPLPQERLTPGRVRRQFSQLRTLVGTPALPPNPCGHPTFRPKGLRYRVVPRRPAVQLTGLTTPDEALRAAELPLLTSLLPPRSDGRLKHELRVPFKTTGFSSSESPLHAVERGGTQCRGEVLKLPLNLVSEERGSAGGALFRRNVFTAGPGAALVAALGPPGLAVERAELLDHCGIGEDQEAGRLAVAAAGRLGGGFQDQADVFY